MTDHADDEPVVCAQCGAVAPDGESLVTWTLQVTGRGRERVCPACSRAGLRGIEGRLDREWWG